MSGTHHGAGAVLSEPLILAYQRYEAIAPNCLLKSQVDFSNSRSNNHLPTLGCAVRTNLAAMIADPADLLGQNALDPADTPRRMDILEKFRTGAPTASQGSEDGAVSSAVN
jgi:pilus assembly protein CpaD